MANRKPIHALGPLRKVSMWSQTPGILETALGKSSQRSGLHSQSHISHHMPDHKQSHPLELVRIRSPQLLRPVHHQDRDTDRGAFSDPVHNDGYATHGRWTRDVLPDSVVYDPMLVHERLVQRQNIVFHCDAYGLSNGSM
jgi:hypothetical protein